MHALFALSPKLVRAAFPPFRLARPLIRFASSAPEFDEATENFNRGLTYVSTGDHNLAMEFFQRSVQVAPTSSGYFNIGNLFLSMGKVNDAVDAFSESIRILPSADSHCNLANIMYTKLNDTQSAINHLQKALALDPTDGEVYFNLGVVLEREGRIDEALQSYSTAKDLLEGTEHEAVLDRLLTNCTLKKLAQEKKSV